MSPEVLERRKINSCIRESRRKVRTEPKSTINLGLTLQTKLMRCFAKNLCKDKSGIDIHQRKAECQLTGKEFDKKVDIHDGGFACLSLTVVYNIYGTHHVYFMSVNFAGHFATFQNTWTRAGILLNYLKSDIDIVWFVMLFHNWH